LRTQIIFIILILNSAFGFSQADSLTTQNIEIKSHIIDSDLGKRVSKHKFELDSIAVKAKRYENKIQAECKFGSSKLKLQIECFFENGILQLIRFTEISEGFKKYDAKKVTEFYYVNGKKVDKKVRSYFPGILAELGVPKDTDKAFGYNKKWTTDFLLILADQIMEQTTE
jgi:hypothetical protein